MNYFAANKLKYQFNLQKACKKFANYYIKN